MGFKRRRTGDLETIAISAETAVDWSVTPKADFSKTRDMKLLKFKEGQLPTTFTLRVLPPGMIARCEARPHPENLLLAASFGIRSCSDPDLGLRWEGDSLDTRHVTEESMKGLPSHVWRELGRVVLDLAELSEGEEPDFFARRG